MSTDRPAPKRVTLPNIGIDVEYLYSTIAEMLAPEDELDDLTWRTAVQSLVARRGERTVHIVLQADDAPRMSDEEYQHVCAALQDKGHLVSPAAVKLVLEECGLIRADQMARAVRTPPRSELLRLLALHAASLDEFDSVKWNLDPSYRRAWFAQARETLERLREEVERLA